MFKKEIFEIYTVNENFNTLIERFPNIHAGNKIILLPADEERHLFYNGTLEIFQYLSTKFDENTVNILGDDDSYRELSLHSKAHWVGVFMISSILAPIFTNVVSDYINNELHAEPKDEIALTIKVVKKDNSTTSIDYRGNAENLDKVFKEVNKLSEANESDKTINTK